MLLQSISLAADDFIVLALRICVCMTFFGHGYLATQTQQSWLAYLRTVGIGSKLGLPLMKLIGVLDIILAFVSLLVYPFPSVHAWCFVWGLATAAMRPLSGEHLMQFIERSGNFIPAIVLVYIETQDKSSQYSFNEWLIISAVVIAAGTVVSVLLRVTRLLAADNKTAKQ